MEPSQSTSDTATTETKPAQPVRVGFVAGGGAMKAYSFHAGVLRGLEEDGFHFRSGPRWQNRPLPPGTREIDTYVGSSAGACVVTGMASGQTVEGLTRALLGTSSVPTFGYRVLYVPVAPHPIKYLRRMARRWRVGEAWPHHLLDVGGVVTASGVERYFRKHVLPTNRFSDLAPRLFLTATQVNNSRKVVFGPTDSLSETGYDRHCAYYDNVVISKALAAAVSVPPIFVPYGIVSPATGKEFHYYDGEVKEPLSTHVARDAGTDFIIASSIWNPYSFDERVGTLADFGMAVLAEQAIHQSIEQKVHRDLERARTYDELLRLIERHGGKHGVDSAATRELKKEICSLLGHRPATTLYVTPDPADSAFFFTGSFRFGRGLVEQSEEAGYRGYRKSVKDNPEFLSTLDRALAQATAQERNAG